MPGLSAISARGPSRREGRGSDRGSRGGPAGGEVGAARAGEVVEQQGGLEREKGDRFGESLVSRGGAADALGLFKNLIGRDPYIEPVLKRRGLDRAAGADDTKVE